MDNHEHLCSLAATSQERYFGFRARSMAMGILYCNRLPLQSRRMHWRLLDGRCRLKQATQTEHEQKINLQRQQADLSRSQAHRTENMSIRIAYNNSFFRKSLR